MVAPAAGILARPPPSTSGPGRHPFKVVARVRIPLGASGTQCPCEVPANREDRHFGNPQKSRDVPTSVPHGSGRSIPSIKATPPRRLGACPSLGRRVSAICPKRQEVVLDEGLQLLPRRVGQLERTGGLDLQGSEGR